MKHSTPIRIKTISEFHRYNELSQPDHPLISVIDYAKIPHHAQKESVSATFDFYTIAIKRGLNYRLGYGQQEYDFDEGVMFFMAPGQVLRVEMEVDVVSSHSGWLLLIHPDFLWNTPLAKNIGSYKYFDYLTNESLFLSQKEELTIKGISKNLNYKSGVIIS